MKRKGTWLNDRARMCPVMARCEGTLLRDGAEMCNACKQYRRPKKDKKELRGEHHLDYEDSRRRP